MADENNISVETYNKIAQKYSDSFFEEFSDKEIVDTFLDLLPVRAHILDAGCGPGMSTKYFMEKGFCAEGIDLSEKMLEIARKKVPKGKFRKMDMRKLEYPDKSFDAVFAAYVIFHAPKKEIIPAMKEFCRVLKPNGILYVAVQEGSGEKFIKEPFDRKLEIFIKFFSEDELKKLIEGAGFFVIKTARRQAKAQGELGSRKFFMIAKKISR